MVHLRTLETTGDRVNQVIMKGMELEINQRPQTVGEFRELLGLVSNQQQSKVQLVSASISSQVTATRGKSLN